jgi:peptide subunit release factor 1 (eRF1)
LPSNELSLGSAPIGALLRDLSTRRSTADPVISLYLDCRWADEHQRDRVRIFVEENLSQLREDYQGSPHADAVERSATTIGRYVDDLRRQAVDEAAGGVALFVCDSLGLSLRFTFRQPFRNEFAADDIPHLLPLARLAEDFEPVIVAVVSAHGARILEMSVGSLVIEERLSRPGARRHRAGGWSQRHWARHIGHQIQRNHREAADHVTFLFDETGGRAHLVIAGPDREGHAFQRFLPERVLGKLLATIPNSREGGGPSESGEIREDLVSRVAARLAVWEEESERRLIDSVVGEALANGLAVVGPDEVILAANERRIHELVLDANFKAGGWRCRTCDALGLRTTIACGFCGSEVTLLDDLQEELVRRVLSADGNVEVVSEPGLAHYHGIGAVLRHRGTADAALGEAAPHP